MARTLVISENNEHKWTHSISYFSFFQKLSCYMVQSSVITITMNGTTSNILVLASIEFPFYFSHLESFKMLTKEQIAVFYKKKP